MILARAVVKLSYPGVKEELRKMPTATTVITPVRFEQGLAYANFLAQAAVNVDKF